MIPIIQINILFHLILNFFSILVPFIMNFLIIIFKLINQLVLTVNHWEPLYWSIFSLFLSKLQKPGWLYLLSIPNLFIVYHQTLLYFRTLNFRILLIFLLSYWQLLIFQSHTHRCHAHRTILHAIFTRANMSTLPNIFQRTRNTIFDLNLSTYIPSEHSLTSHSKASFELAITPQLLHCIQLALIIIALLD